MKLIPPLLLSLLWSSNAFAFEKAELTSGEISALNMGKAIISVWKDTNREHTPSISKGGIDIMAPASMIKDMMLNCERANEISPDIRECIILETSKDMSWDVRKQKFAVSPFLPKFNSTFRTEYSGNALEGFVMKISKISGDLKVQDGRWDIIPLSPTHSRVIYQAAIEPSLPIPDKVIRKQVGIGIPDILKNLRDLVEDEYADSQKDRSLATSSMPEGTVF